MKLLLLFFSSVAWAQTGLRVVDTPSSTQMKIAYTAPSASACTVEVSKNSTFVPLVADVNGTLFSGAASDTPHIVSSSQNQRTLLIGKRRAELDLNGKWTSRALPANNLLNIRVNCGSPQTIQASTGVPHGRFTDEYPINTAAFGQMAYPEPNVTDFSQPVVDPSTGLEIYMMDPIQYSSSLTLPVTAAWYLGGTGWTNLSNVVGYSTTVATTGNTNPLTILLDPTNFNLQAAVRGGYWPYDNLSDLGLDIYGSTSGGSMRQIRACISLDSGQTCTTGYQTITMSGGAGVQGTIPATYPSVFFQSWGKRLQRNIFPKEGCVTATAGAIVLTKEQANCGLAIGSTFASAGAYFNTEWAVGTKIYIATSSPTCTSNFCTVSSVTDSTHLTIAEALTLGEHTYRSADLAIVINKVDAVGTVDISVRWHLAHMFPFDVWTGGIYPTTVTAGDGTVGYPAIFPATKALAGGLFLIGAGNVNIPPRLVSQFVNRGVASCTGCGANDQPNAAYPRLGPSVAAFDPADPTIIYTLQPDQANRLTIYKAHYAGNWSAYSQPFLGNGAIPPVTTEMDWTNLTPGSTGNDVISKIHAGSGYNVAMEAVCGTLGVNKLAISGFSSQGGVGTIILNATCGTGSGFALQDTPGWLFAFDTSGSLLHTWDLTQGSISQNFSAGSLHNASAFPGGAATVSLHTDNYNASYVPFGGPFKASVDKILKLGVFQTDVSLPWPMDGVADAPCSTEPSSSCITVQAKQFCSSVPYVGEAALRACDWDAAKSKAKTMAVGDYIKDYSKSDLDSETLQIMTIATGTCGANCLLMEWKRNAQQAGYCVPISQGGAQMDAQLQHGVTWEAMIVPASTCNPGPTFLLDPVGGTSAVLNNPATRGHFYTVQTSSQVQTLIGAGASLPSGELANSVMIDRPWANVKNAPDFSNPSDPKFSGFQVSSAGISQSYLDAAHWINPAQRRFAFDIRHFNGNTGVEIEYPNQNLGVALGIGSPEAGTSNVYKIAYTGTADKKRGPFTVWAGDKVLRDVSNSTTGSHQITDATTYAHCGPALQAGECRTGSMVGDFYVSIPKMTTAAGFCNASQINNRIPCAFAGPTIGGGIVQLDVAKNNPDNANFRVLGRALCSPGCQYVYSSVLATPDGKHGIFECFMSGGYYSGLCSFPIPPVIEAGQGDGFDVVIVKQTCTSCYVRFGYQEFGDPISANQFFCTTRQEECRVVASSITAATPFKWAYEAPTPVSGSVIITVPKRPGYVMFYQVVDNGVAGPLTTAM